MIDFKAIANAALSHIEQLLEDWLPGGKRSGVNYVACNPVRGETNPSFGVNLSTGAWYDYASGDAGGDLISLYAYIFGLRNVEAARKVAELVGVVIPDAPGGPRAIVPRAAPAPAPVPVPVPKRAASSPWRAILPVPAEAGAYPVAHVKRGRPEHVWEYRNIAGELLGVVYRFRTSTGGKEVLPCVFAENISSGVREWHWIGFPEPRPLYFRSWTSARKVLVVEGEKCVDAAHAVLGDQFNIVSWPGGGNAVDKADWSMLAGHDVLLWPDCDAQRDRDGAIKPPAKQPGIVAMEKLAQQLIPLGCKVRIVDIDAPGMRPEGWDIADAIADGWGAEQLLEYMRRQRKPAGTATQPPAPPAPPPLHGAGAEAADADAIDWTRILYRKNNGQYEECRENVFLVLRDHPAWRGVIGYDEFAAKIMKRKATPFGSPEGEWSTEDDDMLGLWLVQNIGLLIKSNEAIVRGVSMAAHKNRFHPLRMYLEGLAWDGVPRASRWLREAFDADCDSRDDAVRIRRERYLELAGTIFLLCMVKLAYEPGSHYCLILEGLQGEGKSKALRILGGDWFCDTPFTKVGDQNSYMAIQGAWLYEIAELDAFNRSDTTAIKAFMTQPVDRYREPYERRMRDRPRQTAFAGTTNNKEYLKDETGNRRFFPVECRRVNHAWLSANRDQLFAEALHLWKNGALPYPTREDERTYFFPEQQDREIGDPWAERVYRYLYQDVDGIELEKVTTYDVLTRAIGVAADKIDGNRSMATRIGKIMVRLGWKQGRETSGARERFYARPRELNEGVQATEDSDAAL